MTEAERQIELHRARARADLARMRFTNAAHDMLHRLTPERLKEDAMEVAQDTFAKARTTVLANIKRWPFAIGTVAAAFIGLILWSPARMAFQSIARLWQLAWMARQIWKGRA